MQRGFSLVELIIIIVILGILATVASSRFTGPGPFASLAAQDQLISTARFAQQTAMSRGPNVTVSLSIAGNSYQVLIDGNPIPLPGGGVAGTFPDGATIAPDPSVITFDSLGDVAAGPFALTVFVAGEANRAVTIETTGYAH